LLEQEVEQLEQQLAVLISQTASSTPVISQETATTTVVQPTVFVPSSVLTQIQQVVPQIVQSTITSTAPQENVIISSPLQTIKCADDSITNTVSDYSPKSGPPSTVLVITGSGFGNSGQVSFFVPYGSNGQQASRGYHEFTSSDCKTISIPLVGMAGGTTILDVTFKVSSFDSTGKFIAGTVDYPFTFTPWPSCTVTKHIVNSGQLIACYKEWGIDDYWLLKSFTDSNN
jgi:hypothetical protein